jgi:hypothetical protein
VVDASHRLLAGVAVAVGSPVASLRRQEGQTFTEYAIITATNAANAI